MNAQDLRNLSEAYTQLSAKKDDSYLETDMKKRQKNNEKARKDMEKMGTSMKNPHFEEVRGQDTEMRKAASADRKAGDKKLPPSEGKANADKMQRSIKFYDKLTKKEELELDENRRAARAAGGYKDDSKKQPDPSKAGFTGVGNMSIDQIRKMSARMDKEKTQKEGLDPVGQEDGDIDNDGDKDKSDKYLAKRRKAIGKAMKKESFATSDWRDDLSEVMTDDIESKPIKEKKVNNKVTINPKLGEAIEELGGTLLEEIEVDELDIVVEEVYDELIEEGYAEDDVESAIEQALIEASVTMGHDTEGPKVERTRDKLKKKAKGFLGKVAVKAYNKAREAKAAAAPVAQRAKTSAKRGIKKLAQKVVDRMSEEIVSEAVYGGTPPEKKDTRMVVTNADKKANTPAYQKMKAGDKRYKSADHMDEEKKPLPKNKMFRKAGNLGRDGSPEAMERSKKITKTLNKANEEVENVEELYKGKHGQTEKQYQDSRSDAGKMISGDSKMSGSKYAQGRRTGSDAGPQPAGGSKKPASQGKMDSGSRTDLVFRKAALKKKAAEMKEDAAMSPQEIQLQKKKAMLDRMIAQKRQQGLNKANKAEAPAPAKAMGEETEDSLKDRRMERGGVDGNNRYNSAPKNVAMGGGKKKPYDGMSALEKVKASIRAKHGQGAIMDTKKK